jgi:hypothetical protein
MPRFDGVTKNSPAEPNHEAIFWVAMQLLREIGCRELTDLSQIRDEMIVYVASRRRLR